MHLGGKLRWVPLFLVFLKRLSLMKASLAIFNPYKVVIEIVVVGEPFYADERDIYVFA